MDEVDSFEDCQQFRKNIIDKMVNDLNERLNTRTTLVKRYKILTNFLHWAETACFITAVSIASVGAGGVITNIVSIPIAVVCSVMGLSGKIVNPQLKNRVKKHENKLNRIKQNLDKINKLISTSINNGEISASEFEFIVDQKLKMYQEI